MRSEGSRLVRLAAVALSLAGLAGPTAVPARADEAGAPAPVELRSFTLRHRPLDEAYRAVAPLLSDSADVRLVRSEQRLEIRDQVGRLQAVATALERFDRGPRGLALRVRILRGEKRPAPAVVSEAAAGVPRDVRDLLGYNVFEALGAAELRLEEGKSGETSLGPDGGYRLRVEVGAVDGDSGAIELRRLALERRLHGEDGRVTYRPVFQFAEELQSGRPRVLCATSGASDRRALFLLVTAEAE